MPVTLERVAVLGLGTMGQGIAAVIAASGRSVRVFDLPTGLNHGVNALHRRYSRLLDGLGREADGRPEAPKVRACASIAEVVRGAHLVIEAVPEDLNTKRALLSDLSGHVDRNAIVATNTSSIPVAELAAAAPDPRRFLATHFFNPAELVPGVEVAPGTATGDEVVSEVMRFLVDIGKDPTVVGAGAGFVANRLQLALFLEALACVRDGMATPEDVDKVVRTTFGFRLPAYGPFAVADMAGLDVYANILEVLRQAYGDRFAIPEALRELVENGRIGCKAGAGFRDYSAEQLDRLVDSRDGSYRRILEAAAA